MEKNKWTEVLPVVIVKDNIQKQLPLRENEEERCVGTTVIDAVVLCRKTSNSLVKISTKIKLTTSLKQHR